MLISVFYGRAPRVLAFGTMVCLAPPLALAQEESTTEEPAAPQNELETPTPAETSDTPQVGSETVPANAPGETVESETPDGDVAPAEEPATEAMPSESLEAMEPTMAPEPATAPQPITAFEPMMAAEPTMAPEPEAAPAAAAEPTPKAQDDSQIEVITVTTERRQQSIQEVAASVQAFTLDDLQAKGVGSELRNLQFVVPGLQITNQEGQTEVFIRGVGSSNNDFSSDPAVATHYNGIYIARPRGIGPMFFDLERVEVNKGPQGTLRGRNATGGTLNIVAKRPDLYETGGYARAGVGNFNQLELEGAINVPLHETAAVRAAVFNQRHSAYYSNALANGVEAPGAENNFALRGSLLYEPTEQFTALVVFDYAQQNGTGDPGQFWGGSLSAGFDTGDLDDPRNQFFLQEGEVSNDLWGLMADISYDFGPVIASYNGGIRVYDFFNRNARRPFQRGVNFPGVDNSGEDLDNFGTFHQLEESNAIVQELRLSSPDDARFRWTVGGFFYREEFGRVSWDILDKSRSQGNLGGQSVTLPESSIQSLAAFGDATFDITDRLRVKAGLRYTDETKEERRFQAQYGFNFDAGVDTNDIRFGTPGFRFKKPSRLNFTNPLQADPTAQFLDAIRSFGGRDTLGNLIAANPGSVFATVTDPNGVETATFDADFINWRAGLEFDVSPDSMVYGTASTGTRSGGINPTFTLPDGTPVPVTFDPEDLLVLEVGSRNQFMVLGRQLIVNATGFFYRYTDQVLQALVAAEGAGAGIDEQQNFLTNTNAGNSSLFGLELDGMAFLPAGLTFGWNIAYLNSSYDDGTIVNDSRLPQESDFIDFDGDGNTQEALPQVNVDLGGGPLQNTSTWNVILSLREELFVDWGLLKSIDATLNYTFRSEFFLTPFGGRGFDFNGNEIPLEDVTRPSSFSDQNGNFLSDRVPATHVLNLNLGFNLGEETPVRIEGFVSNLTNETFPGKGFVNAFVNIRYLNVPRTFGTRITGTF